MREKETLLLVAFARADIAGADIISLSGRAGSVSALFAKPAYALKKLGAAPRVCAAITDVARTDLDFEARLLIRERVRAIPWMDPSYPDALGSLPDKPSVLFVRGDSSALDHATVAIVGTRRVSRNGMDATRRVTDALVACDVTVVSGLAFGTDAIAHATVVENDGKTVAVLASGVDAPSVGPRGNAGLAERLLAKGGALVSEYPPGLTGMKHRFPRRNRIIAGLSTATAVIEAPERSGALITAHAALEYGRDVFAAPGPMTDARCAGTNALIASGAIPICTPDTITDYYGLTRPRPTYRVLSGHEPAVIHAIANGADTLDAIAAITRLPIPELLVTIGELELIGTVRSTAGTYSMIDSVCASRLP